MKNLLKILMAFLIAINFVSALECSIKEIRYDEDTHKDIATIMAIKDTKYQFFEIPVDLLPFRPFWGQCFKMNFECEGCDELLYYDVVLQKYNDSCIETSNWQYLFINYSDEEIKEEFVGTNNEFMIEEIEQIGEKAMVANIYFLEE